MAQNLSLALQITGIGMGLVFGSIILFWLLMAVMVRLTNERLNHKPHSAPLRGLAGHEGHEGHEGLVDAEQPSPGGSPNRDLRQGGAPVDGGLRRRAAVAAVAVALARRSGTAGLPARLTSPSAQASAWQVVQRAKSLRIFPRGRAR